MTVHMDPGTLFPALDGGDPGSAEKSADITDLPLEPMSAPDPETQFQEGDGLAGLPGSQIVGGGQHRFIDQGGEGLAPQVPQGTQPAVELPSGDGRRRRSAEDRINKLVGKYHQTRDENSMLREEIGRLSEQMGGLQRALLSGSAPAASSPQPGIAGLGNPDPNPAGAPDLDTRIARAVQAAIAPVLQTVTNSSQASQMRAAHEESLVEAVEDFPELADPKSKFASTFRSIFAKSPLKELTDGPYQVAMQVRGILADQRADERRTDSRKRAAVVHTPTPVIPEQASQVGPTAHERKAYADAVQKFRSGSYEFSDYRTIRVLRDKYKQLR